MEPKFKRRVRIIKKFLVSVDKTTKLEGGLEIRRELELKE